MREVTVRYVIAIAAAAALLAGCASAPRRSAELTRARAAVEALSSKPQSVADAGPDLKSARSDLHRADLALRNGRPMSEVKHFSYLALRYAEAGEARVSAAQAHAQVASATHERDKLLLEAQQRRAQSAASQAEQARNQAQQAKNQARQTRQELARAKSQAGAARHQVASLRQQLKQLKHREINAKRTSQGMVMTLSNVLFATNKSTLQPGAGLELTHLAGYLKSHPKTRVLIEGNTDDTGSAAYNQRLSRARAHAVAHALELRGVASKQLEPVGLGEAYPVASNSTAAGRQQNRRVDVVFSNSAGRFAEAAIRRKTSVQR